MGKSRITKVKICGITCVEDAVAASEAGTDAIGFVFADKSKRRVSPERVEEIVEKLDPFVITVGVFVDAPLDLVLKIKRQCQLNMVQLHGKEDDEYIREVPGRVIKAVTPSQDHNENTYRGATLLVDQPGGGTGKTFDWNRVLDLSATRDLILAGGLNADNVKKAIETVRPYAVDVSSGVEKGPGRKDHHEIRRFIKRARAI